MNKILVVDDDRGVQMLYADELTDEGYDVVTSGDGSHLVELIKEERPDLVVMDMKLGEYDGVDLLQNIRNAFDQLPVILCTAYPSAAHHLKTVGADGYVLKSSDLSELKLRIGQALDERKGVLTLGDQRQREGVNMIHPEQMDLPLKGTV